MSTLVRLVSVAALVVAGCAGSHGGYDQRGGPEIANQIRLAASPIVEEVAYNPGDYVDAATIDIVLQPGATPSEARAFICSVALPLIATGDPPDSLGIAAWDAGSTRIVASDLDPCPSTAPAS